MTHDTNNPQAPPTAEPHDPHDPDAALPIVIDGKLFRPIRDHLVAVMRADLPPGSDAERETIALYAGHTARRRLIDDAVNRLFDDALFDERGAFHAMSRETERLLARLERAGERCARQAERAMARLYRLRAARRREEANALCCAEREAREQARSAKQRAPRQIAAAEADVVAAPIDASPPDTAPAPIPVRDPSPAASDVAGASSSPPVSRETYIEEERRSEAARRAAG
jgi:hypothetical protein